MTLENQLPRIEELWALVDTGALSQETFNAHMQQRQDAVYRSCGQRPPQTYRQHPLNDHALS